MELFSLVNWLKTQDNKTLNESLETLVDKISFTVHQDVIETRLRATEISVRVERPDLLRQWKENANIVLQRKLIFGPSFFPPVPRQAVTSATAKP